MHVAYGWPRQRNHINLRLIFRINIFILLWGVVSTNWFNYIVTTFRRLQRLRVTILIYLLNSLLQFYLIKLVYVHRLLLLFVKYSRIINEIVFMSSLVFCKNIVGIFLTKFSRFWLIFVVSNGFDVRKGGSNLKLVVPRLLFLNLLRWWATVNQLIYSL